MSPRKRRRSLTSRALMGAVAWTAWSRWRVAGVLAVAALALAPFVVSIAPSLYHPLPKTVLVRRPAPAATVVDPSAPAADTDDVSSTPATPQQRQAAAATATGFVTGLLAEQANPDPQARVVAVADYASVDEQQLVAATDPAMIPDAGVASFTITSDSTNQVSVAVALTDSSSIDVAVVSDGEQWVVVDFQVSP